MQINSRPLNNGSLFITPYGNRLFSMDESTFLAILKKWDPRIGSFVWPWQDKLELALTKWFKYLACDYDDVNLKLKDKESEFTLIVSTYDIEIWVIINTIHKYRSISIILPAHSSIKIISLENIIRNAIGLPSLIVGAG
jgi:hypothetical protein